MHDKPSIYVGSNPFWLDNWIDAGGLFSNLLVFCLQSIGSGQSIMIAKLTPLIVISAKFIFSLVSKKNRFFCA